MIFVPMQSGGMELTMAEAKYICMKCWLDLPVTNFHLDPENNVARLFWGRVNIQQATSYFFYRNVLAKFTDNIYAFAGDSTQIIKIIYHGVLSIFYSLSYVFQYELHLYNFL